MMSSRACSSFRVALDNSVLSLYESEKKTGNKQISSVDFGKGIVSRNSNLPWFHEFWPAILWNCAFACRWCYRWDPRPFPQTVVSWISRMHHQFVCAGGSTYWHHRPTDRICCFPEKIGWSLHLELKLKWWGVMILKMFEAIGHSLDARNGLDNDAWPMPAFLVDRYGVLACGTPTSGAPPAAISRSFPTASLRNSWCCRRKVWAAFSFALPPRFELAVVERNSFISLACCAIDSMMSSSFSFVPSLLLCSGEGASFSWRTFRIE